jgi:peptidyl-prolyl cis-trans isomerase C
MKKQLLTATLAAALLGAMAPAFAQNLAIVNGKPIPKSRVDALAQQMARAGRPVPPEQQNQLKDEVVAREIFMQEARKRGLDTTEDYKNQLELARQSILIRELFADYQKKNPVSDAEAKAEYDKFVAANGGKEYRARHILVENEDEAKAIVISLKKGGKFDEIAKKSSKDPGSGANGGDLDWASAGSYVPEFSAAMVKLEKGQLTEVPVKTQFGWHVIRLDDVREAKLPPVRTGQATDRSATPAAEAGPVPGRTARQGQGRVSVLRRATATRLRPRFCWFRPVLRPRSGTMDRGRVPYRTPPARRWPARPGAAPPGPPSGIRSVPSTAPNPGPPPGPPGPAPAGPCGREMPPPAPAPFPPWRATGATERSCRYRQSGSLGSSQDRASSAGGCPAVQGSANR